MCVQTPTCNKVFGTKKSFIFDDKGARIFVNRDPHESKKIITKKNIYGGKAFIAKILKN